jgi:toxin ParE1/3/4
MSLKVQWSDAAEREFREIIGLIFLEQPGAAEYLQNVIVNATRHLGEFPGLGHPIKQVDSKKDYRELIIPPCRVIYQVDEVTVRIITIMRTERNARVTYMVAEEANNFYQTGIG